MTENRKPGISVVIPAWNGQAFLADCLTSLRQHTQVDYEVIVVDNGSRDRTVEVAGGYSEVRLISNLVNQGFSRAVNQGIKAACHEVVFLLNQDTVALGDWARPILKRFEDCERVGIVGCKLLYPDGTLQHAGGRVIEPTFDTEHLRRDDPGAEIDYVTGAAMAIHSTCLAEVGLFDEGFFPAYFEDVDYCLRAEALGWKVVYEPRSELTHFESQTQEIVPDFLAVMQTQRLRLMLKHRSAKWVYENYLPFERRRIRSCTSAEWALAMAQSCLAVACDVRSIAWWHSNFYEDGPVDNAIVVLLASLFEIRDIARLTADRIMFDSELEQSLTQLESLAPPMYPPCGAALPIVGSLAYKLRCIVGQISWLLRMQTAFDAKLLDTLRAAKDYFGHVRQLSALSERDIQACIWRSQSLDTAGDSSGRGAARGTESCIPMSIDWTPRD